MSVSSGSVTIEDGLKSSVEYQPARKVSVTLDFDVDHGSDAQKVLEIVAQMAHAQVRRSLHQEPGEVVKRAETALLKAEPAIIVPTKEEVATLAVVADAGVNDPADVDAKIEAITTAQKGRKAANKQANGSAADVGADLASFVAEEPEIVTDVILHSEIMKAQTGGAKKDDIMALIKSYDYGGKVPSASLMTQENRRDFVVKLKAL